jgi:uncharacterized protein (DUF1697 family)
MMSYPAVARHILFLRGINLGSRNRIAMPELREILAAAGFDDVRTYLQSGNVVVASKARSDDVARKTERLIAAHFGLDIAVVVRTRAQLAKIVERNPLQRVAKNPKRYQVSFLDSKPRRDVIEQVEAAAEPPEQVVAIGREIYAWHPETIARSRLWTLLAGQKLGVVATARNWTTVTSLLALADD